MILFAILGIIQGFTEFLPISSSGHLYLIGNILKIETSFLSFFVWLHLATLCVILLYFWREIYSTLRERRVAINIVLVTFITSCVAIGIKKLAGSYFDNSFFISFSFLVTASLLLFSRFFRTYKNIEECGVKDFIILGLVQGFAVIPGISRSGITIAALMKRGVKAQEAFKLSFLVAVPVILAAFVWESKHIMSGEIEFPALAIGFIFAFISGFLALKILDRIINKEHLHIFGYYCILIGISSLLIGILSLLS